MTKALLLVAALAACAAATGCQPKPGASCKTELKEACLDGKSALACHGGKWEEMSCRGPDGCSKHAGERMCDQSVAEPGDVCNLSGDYICAADQKAMLECVNLRWTLAQRCLGERGCTVEERKVACDDSLANLGDACRGEEEYACAVDRKSALVCRQGAFIEANLCEGPKGCRVTGSKAQGIKVECDASSAKEGGPCEREGHYSCSSDESTILKCLSEKFEVADKCKPKERCQIRGGQVGCY